MYIFKIIVLLVLFLVIIYFFLFRTTRRRQRQDFNSVQEYHDAYLHRKSRLNPEYEYHIQNKSTNRYMRLSGDSNSGFGRTNTITKYNSNEDYREK